MYNTKELIMRYYFEVKSEDRYTGLITMLDNKVMEFKHCNCFEESACLMDTETGECYPILAILSDGDTTVYVTEV
jgi:hypothetical protein